MATVVLSPIFNGYQSFLASGLPNNAGFINTYAAGSSTPLATYTTSAGSIANPVAIPLSASGFPPNEIWLDVTLAYKFVVTDSSSNIIGTYDNIVGNPSLATLALSSGSSLVGFIQSGTGAVARTVQSKERDIVSVLDFGAMGDGTTDDTSAINSAIASGHKCIFFPAGTYKTTGLHNINGLNGIQLIGAGQGASYIDIAHATNNLFYVGATPTYDLRLSGFTITSSVTRTAGWVFAVVDAYNSTGTLEDSTFSNLKILNQVNGLWIAKYQFVNLQDLQMYQWVGTGGIGIKAGQTTSSNANQGSQLYIRNAQIYGNNLVGGPATLAYGLWIEDTDAVEASDMGIGGVVVSDMMLKANSGGHGPSNHFFTTCVFDATKTGPCIDHSGSGTFQQITYTTPWIASAGKVSGGSVEAVGMNFPDTPTYSNISVTGGTIYNCSGSGIKITKGGSITFGGGLKVVSNGGSAATNKYGLFVNPTAASSLGLTVSGCAFSNATGDAYFAANSRNYNISGGNTFNVGVTNLGALSRFSGNFDYSSNTVASATTITISPNQNTCNVTGTTNITGISATYDGHDVQFVFAGILTVQTGVQNIQLTGNFTTAAGSALTLHCDGATWREIGRKA